MQARLRRALKRGELELRYQPQASLADGGIRSVEALLRWNDPELGWIPPSLFIPLAEESGLVHAIGAWVIDTAGAQAKAWHDAGQPVTMCINVSPKQLGCTLVGSISRLLATTQLPASAFELEITEGSMLAREPATEAAIEALRVLGIGFAIDDFGTGYATFEYIKRLPARTLKLDGTFVRGVCDNADDAAIVGASVHLARSLGLRIVAECVETAEQHDRLRKLGCHDGQGHYVCRPLSAPQLEEFLASRRRARPRLAIAR
jgi:EAL domain-containing protein (putative c-di-GMP-specific phosphodiesterase class I)